LEFIGFFFFGLTDIFLRIMSGSVLLHRQLSPEKFQQLIAWYKIRDMLLGQNYLEQHIKKVLELASMCNHPNAVWLTKLFAGRDVASREEGRQVFLACENGRELFGLLVCLEGLLMTFVELLFLVMRLHKQGWQCILMMKNLFREKSTAQGERDGFHLLGVCYQYGSGCVKDVARAKENYLSATELGHVFAMVCVGELFDEDDPQRFVWLGRAAADGYPFCCLGEISDQMRSFNNATGQANVVFAIGRALKGHIDNEERTIFGEHFEYNARIGRKSSSSFLPISIAIVSKSSRKLVNYRIEKQSRERHSKNDWKDDLGCERRSSVCERRR
jgi:TPR repeat protein